MVAGRKFNVSVIFGAVDKASKKIRANWLALTAVAAGLIFATKKIIDAAAQQELAEVKLFAALRNVKTATEGGSDALIAQAAALQKTTGFADEQTIAAQAMLATFQLNEKQIAAITPRLLDMAAASEKAGGQQQDLQAIAIALGKGFTGQAGQLSRYGVVLDKQAIKTQGFNGILKSLDDNFKGIAESAGTTAAGQMRILNANIGDVQEQLGKVLLPVVNDVAKQLSEFLTDEENIKKFVGGFRTIVKAVLFAGVSMLNFKNNADLIFDTLAIQAAKLATKITGIFRKDKDAVQELLAALDDEWAKSVTSWEDEVIKFDELWKKTMEDQKNELPRNLNDRATVHQTFLDRLDTGWSTFWTQRQKEQTDFSKSFKTLFTNIEKGFDVNLQAMIKGTQSFGSVVQNIFADVGAALIGMVTKEAAVFIASQIAKAVAGAMAAHSGIPFVGIGLGIAAAAAIVSEINRAKAGANLAVGGIATSPITANIAEGGRAEAVLPLQSPRAKRMLAGIGGQTFVIQNNTFVGIGGLDDLVDVISEAQLDRVGNVRNV